MWKRYRLKTYSVDDNRPLIFNPKYPWWCSGSGEDSNGEYDVIISYLPPDEDLLKYWDDAFDIDVEDREEITFTDRFPKPDYYVES
jgi:hypothetical protein